MKIFDKIVQKMIDSHAEQTAYILKRYTQPMNTYSTPWQQYIDMAKAQAQAMKANR